MFRSFDPSPIECAPEANFWFILRFLWKMDGADVLPNPTSDLQWGFWNGAIHEILHKNASKFPERPCVVETNPWRTFTYSQIDQASNVLAHHLVASGVTNGDVVMIYAFRNVDLVVAIMGTLKAGATFSG